MPLSKPTNGSNADYANRIGLLFDAFNNGNYAFPATQVPSADANTLDDYEEGTWTPAVAFGGASVGITYTTQAGHYTKIGRVVVLCADAVLSAKGSSTGGATFGGFPFAVKNSVGARASAALVFSNITFTGQFHGYAEPAGSSLTLGQTIEAGTYSVLADTNFTSTSQVIMQLSYFV